MVHQTVGGFESEASRRDADWKRPGRSRSPLSTESIRLNQGHGTLNPSYSPNPWMVLPFVLLLALHGGAAPGLPAMVGTALCQGGGRAVGGDGGLLCVRFAARGVSRLWPERRGITSASSSSSLRFMSSRAAFIFKSTGRPTPAVNTLFLALGGLVSNVLGTTGASVLLIRPWLRLNRQRAAAHHVVFFIFIVCNVGGCLTPMGDPPLLVGFLKGVPFWWVLRHCWPMWLCSMAFLLARVLLH